MVSGLSHFGGIMNVICRTVSLLTFCSAAAFAQKSQPIEIGFDASLASIKYNYNQNTPNGQRQGSTTSTLFAFPIQSVRVGFPLNDRIALEPSLGFMHASTDGLSQTGYDARVALVVALTQDRHQPQWFARPFVGVAHDWQGLLDTHTTLGVGAGVRLPMADRIASRIEGRYTYYSMSNFDGGHELGLYFGLSFFTH